MITAWDQIRLEEREFILRARLYLEIARIERRQAEYGSDRYWQLLRFEVEREAVVADLAWHLKGGFLIFYFSYTNNNRRAYKKSKTAYFYHKERREARLQGIAERRRIFNRRKAEARLLLSADTNPIERAMFIELLFSTTNEAKCPRRSFVRDVMETYGRAGVVGRVSGRCWCPVRCKKVQSTELRAVAIFPHSLGQQCMTYIFGPEAEDKLYSTSNGLLLPPKLAEMFSQYRVTLIPTGYSWDERQHPWSWKLVIVDWEGLWNEPFDSETTYGELHETNVSFFALVLPNGAFLFFHYLCAMLLQARRDRANGVPLNEQGMLDAWMEEGEEAKVHKGSYVRDTVVAGFVEEFDQGHVSRTFRKKILAHSRPTGGVQEAVDLLGDLDPEAEMDEDEESEEEAGEALDKMIQTFAGLDYGYKENVSNRDRLLLG